MIDTSDLRSYQHLYAASDAALWPVLYLAWEPRLGKTRAEVRAIRRRIAELGERRTLVVGPLKPLQITWRDELEAAGFRRPREGASAVYVPLLGEPTSKTLARPRTVRHRNRTTSTSTEATKTTWAAEVVRDLIAGAAGTRPVVVLVNFEILERYVSKSVRLSDLLQRWAPQSIIVDEAHFLSSASSERSRALRRLGRAAPVRRALSGTPDPNSLADLYAQYAFLAPEIFGTNKQKFLERYFITNPFVHGRIEGERLEMRAELEARALSVMYRVRARDVFDVPPANQIVREIPWPAAARALYDQLARESVLRPEDGIVIDGTHKLTRLLRFLQLCAGFLTDEVSGELRWFQSAKTETLVAELAEPLAAGQRAVVSYVFTPEGERLAADLARRYGAERVALVNGHTPEREATRLLSLFGVNCTEETPLRVLVVQESVGGVGISLARANHLFFSSWTMDAAAHQQMRLRVWDPARPANYTYLQMERSADGFARAIVQRKIDASLMHRQLIDSTGFLAALNGQVTGALAA